MAARCGPKVEVGQRRDGKVEMVSGVTAGEVVVVSGHQRLRDGVPVAVKGAGCRRGPRPGRGEGRESRAAGVRRREVVATERPMVRRLG